MAFMDHFGAFSAEYAQLFLSMMQHLENYEKLTGLSSFGGQYDKKWTLEHALSFCHGGFVFRQAG